MFRKNKDNKKLYKLFFFLLFLSLSIFIFNKTSISHRLDGAINQISSKSIYFLDNFIQKAQFIISRIKLNSSLYQENIELKKELALLTNQLEKTHSCIDENRLLKDEVNYHSSIHNNVITTELLSVTQGPYIKEALISAGREAGVERGDIVLYKEMILGRVIEVYNGFSKVILVFDSRSKISAITSVTRKKILLEGNNSNRFTIKYLPETDSIDDNEFALTSNYCSLFPPGIKIGIVNAKNHNFPYVSVPYKIKDIRYVQIIHNNITDSYDKP